MKAVIGGLIAIFAGLLLLTSCSTISRFMREMAVDVSFERLVRHTDEYVGETVILGGYIQEIRNVPGKVRMVILQAPLGMFDQPKSKKYSEGKFYVLFEGLLDCEKYEEGQDVTIAGTVLGRRIPEFNGTTVPLVTVKALEIHRWYYFGQSEVDRCDGYDPLMEALPETHEPPPPLPPPPPDRRSPIY